MCIRDRVGVVRSGVDDYIMSHGCKPGTELFDMVFDPPVGGRKALLPDHCDAHVSPSLGRVPANASRDSSIPRRGLAPSRMERCQRVSFEPPTGSRTPVS